MVGDYKWGLRTEGNLNVFSKVVFAYEAMKAKKEIRQNNSSFFLTDDNDLKIPDSKLITTTFEFLYDTQQQFLINHCIRTYLFGKFAGKNQNVIFDDEVFLIAALLHDVGLSKKLQNKHQNCKCFAVEGAIISGHFLHKNNCDENSIAKIQNAISLHLNIKVPIDMGEAYLLQKGAALDVIGRDLKKIPKHFLDETLSLYPRLDFKNQMDELMYDQSIFRPKSRISFLYANGFSELIKHSGFEE